MKEPQPLKFIKSLPLAGNPLDFIVYTTESGATKPTMIISQDTFTKQGRTTDSSTPESESLDEKRTREPSKEPTGEVELKESSNEDLSAEVAGNNMCKPLVAYEFEAGQFKQVEGLEFEENKVDVQGKDVNLQKLFLLLYPLGSLRKREGEDKGEADD